MSDLQQFIGVLSEQLLPDERLTATAFFGDPKGGDHRKWRVHPVNSRDGRWVVPGNDAANRYVSVGAFKPDAVSGEYYRQDNFWRCATALMIDDLGREIGGSVKIEFSVLQGVPPTFIIETSPGNHQAWYVFAEPCREKKKFERLVAEFIEKKCGGIDPGMAGTTRVGRTPESTNGKPENNGWKVRFVHNRPALRYTPEQLAALWGLDIEHIPWEKKRRDPPSDTSGLTANFELVLQMLAMWGHNKRGKTGLDRRGLLDASDFNNKGWMPIRCPWTHEHGGGVDDGAGVMLPLESNNHIGGFACHHGHCLERTYGDLLRYVNETLNDEVIAETAALLDKINREAQRK